VGDEIERGSGLRSGQCDQHRVAGTTGAEARPPTEDAFAIFPEEMEIAYSFNLEL
jgi:hypothetical protein